MANLTERLTEIVGNETHDQLKRKLKENIATLQRIIDELTGQRIEDWTPVRRDGSVSMKGDLILDGGSLIHNADSSIPGKAAVRSTKAGVSQYSHDGKTYFSQPRTGGSKGTALVWPQKGSVPLWGSMVGNGLDVTSDRDFNVVYRNTGKAMIICQITVKLS